MPSQPEFTVEPQGFLRFHHVNRVVEHIQAGGLCLLPSDSSYILTGLPTRSGVTQDLDVVLQRDGLEMSLAFGSMREMHQWVDLSDMALKFVGRLTPGGLTFVAPPSTGARRGHAAARLHAPRGNIGIRFTESRVETQLAYEVDQPLTSTPVRHPDGSATRTAEEALAVIADGVSALPSRRELCVIVGSVSDPGRLSTVAQETSHYGLHRIRVLRKGAIPIETIRRVALECRYEGVDGS